MNSLAKRVIERRPSGGLQALPYHVIDGGGWDRRRAHRCETPADRGILTEAGAAGEEEGWRGVRGSNPAGIPIHLWLTLTIPFLGLTPGGQPQPLRLRRRASNVNPHLGLKVHMCLNIQAISYNLPFANSNIRIFYSFVVGVSNCA